MTIKYHRIDSFYDKFNSENSNIQLNQNDINLLTKVIDYGVKRMKVTFFRALCNLKFCCRKNR